MGGKAPRMTWPAPPQPMDRFARIVLCVCALLLLGWVIGAVI